MTLRRAFFPALLFLLAAAGTHPVAAQEPVLIGLVVPTTGPLAGVGAEVRRGVELAIERANSEGGLHGRPFELRVVTQEGLWGQGLGRVVSLSFDEPIWAVIGGLDGRSAHLIQQVITKARIPFVTPWASDPTLSRAMVPWFFQAVPDDRQQADAMVADAAARGLTDLRVLADTAYDSRRLAAALGHAATARRMRIRVLSAAAVLRAPDPDTVPTGRDVRDETAIFITDAIDAPALLQRLGRLQAPPRVYVPLRFAGTGLRELAAYPGPLGIPTPDIPGSAEDPRLQDDLPAAFAYDAARALVAAIRAAGLDRTAIRDALADHAGTGLTGTVAFDELGRRITALRVRRGADLPRGSPGS